MYKCSEECVNTIEGYRCSCKPGYQLTDDGFTCEGLCHL